MNDLQSQNFIRKTIYRPTNEVGVRSIWSWSEKVKDYVQKKSGNKFQAYIEKNGRTYSESFGSIQEAVKWRSRLKIDFDRTPDVKPMNFRKLFDEFYDHKKSVIRVSTLESYKSLTKHFGMFWELDVLDINSRIVDDWLRLVKSEDYRAKNKVKSVRLSYLHEVDLLSLIFKFYKEYFNEKFENPVRERHRKDAIIDRAKFEQKKAKEKIKFISSEDIERLISTFRDLAIRKPLKKLYFVSCLTQLRTGMRIGEIFALNWQDINWIDGVLEVNKTIQWMRTNARPSTISMVPKNGRNRTIILLPEVLEELKELQKHQARITGLIFSEDGVKIPSYSCVQHQYERAMKQAGVNHKSTHIMRHSFATHFMETTKDPIALKGILGHSTLKMTDKYAKVTDRTVFEGMEKFKTAIGKLA